MAGANHDTKLLHNKKCHKKIESFWRYFKLKNQGI